MSTEAQSRQILQWLKDGNHITALSALKKFRCLRLSGRIHDLRRQGHRIETQPVKVNGKRIARYKLA